MKKLTKFSTVLLILLGYAQLSLYAQQSLYSDVKANRVGDVITVVLTENISGSSSTDARTKSNTSGQASSSVSGNFIPFEPYFGADASVDYNSNEQMTANQQQLLTGTLSVRIERITDNGDLIVQGNRSTEINGELHQISLQGVVRPNDVDDLNRVPSYRIADAEIVYRKKGGLRQEKHKPGLVRKMIFGAVGVAVGTVAIMKSMN